MSRSTAYVVVPDSVDDPLRPRGGNEYDRRICAGLAQLGWRVNQHSAGGAWPSAAASADSALARWLAGVPDGSVVVIDGLIASAVPGVLVPEADRLLLVILVHLPLGARSVSGQLDGAAIAEAAVLQAAAAVITTSEWTRRWLLDTYSLSRAGVRVAEPGVDLAPPVLGSRDGDRLVCVAAVTARKGHDLLLSALAILVDLRWRCSCVGSLEVEPGYVHGVRRQSENAHLADRVCFVGPRTGSALQDTYATPGLRRPPPPTESPPPG